MRSHGSSALAPVPTPDPSVPVVPPKSDWHTLQRLFPYLWTYKWRVIIALTFMVGAKLTNVGVPLLLKDLVDRMSYKPGDPAALLVVPVALLFAYGALRLSTTLLTELRELVFSKATQAAADAREFELVATQGLATWGICSAPFLEHAFRTVEGAMIALIDLANLLSAFEAAGGRPLV